MQLAWTDLVSKAQAVHEAAIVSDLPAHRAVPQLFLSLSTTATGHMLALPGTVVFHPRQPAPHPRGQGLSLRSRPVLTGSRIHATGKDQATKGKPPPGQDYENMEVLIPVPHRTKHDPGSVNCLYYSLLPRQPGQANPIAARLADA